MANQIVEQAGVRMAGDVFLGPIKNKIEQAKRDRARFEPVWHSNRAFAAGKFWLRWSRADRRLKLDPRDVKGGQERHTVDILTQNLMTALGQLSGVEQRKDLRFRREDVPSEDFTEAANKALAYGWDVEWLAPEQLASVKRKLMVDGTAAIQCYFDPTQGRELGEVPLGDGLPVEVPSEDGMSPPQMVETTDGEPITDGPAARAYMADRAVAGGRPSLKALNEGKICWKPRSVFQVLVPPGVENEDDFPWEAIVSAVSIDSLVERYGDKAKDLHEEPLAVLEQVGLKDSMDSGFGADPESDPGVPGKLDGHVALVEYFERPSRKHKRGRVVTFAGDMILDVQPELPYRTPRGDYHSGIVYFRYWRVEGRFWGRGLIEPGKGIQRTYNKRSQQEHVTIDRGQPKIIVDESTDDDAIAKTGEPVEILRLGSQTTRAPQVFPGVPVHDAVYRSKEGLLGDLERAMGVHAVSTGEAPAHQTTYAELALRSEKDRTKIDPIVEDFQSSVDRLIELSVYDIRRWWTKDKLIALAGQEGTAEAVEFEGSKLPEFFLLEIAEGAGKPRTEAATLQLITDLMRADLEHAQATGQPPRLDLDWYKGSLEAGAPLDFPEEPTDLHTELARWENSHLVAGDRDITAAPEDPPAVHIPIHREQEIEARMADDLDTYERIEAHIQEHLQVQQEIDMQLRAEAPAPDPMAQMAQAQEQMGPPAPPAAGGQQ